MLRLVLVSAIILTGVASQYAPGVMVGVIRARQAGLTSHDLPERLPDVDGYVAARDCADIGKIVFLRPVGRAWERFLVVDCAGRYDRQGPDDTRSGYQWMVDGGVLVEVDALTAHRWGAVGRSVDVEMIGAREYAQAAGVR